MFKEISCIVLIVILGGCKLKVINGEEKQKNDPYYIKAIEGNADLAFYFFNWDSIRVVKPSPDDSKIVFNKKTITNYLNQIFPNKESNNIAIIFYLKISNNDVNEIKEFLIKIGFEHIYFHRMSSLYGPPIKYKLPE